MISQLILTADPLPATLSCYSLNYSGIGPADNSTPILEKLSTFTLSLVLIPKVIKMSETSLPPLRIGTRRSKLAIVQAESIRDQLQKIAPNRTFEIETLHTAGDRDKVTPLNAINAKNLWTTELEEKLTSGDLDVVVHCLKGK